MPTNRLRVCLVETALPDEQGSMRRYASLIEQAFADDPTISIERACVARDVSWLPGKLATLAHHSSNTYNARRLARKSSADLFHVIDGSRGYLAESLRKRKVVVTVHDIIPKLQCMGKFNVPPPGVFSRLIIDKAINGLCSANHLIFDSRSTENDFEELPNGGVESSSVVFPPLEPTIFNSAEINSADHDYQPSSTSDAPYIFHIGNNGFYKNRIAVIRVFAEISSDIPHRLIMAGPVPTPEMRSLADRLRVADRIEFRSRLSDQEVFECYRNASAFVFPSLYEGFGWPPIEAMAMGCPAVCSDGGSLGEVVGNAALVSAVGDELSMAGDLKRLLTDDSEGRRLVDLGYQHVQQFGLQEFAGRLRTIYQDVKLAEGK